VNFGNINKIQVDGNIFQNSELQVFPIQKNATCRISNIYGKNGSGKTTISKAIKGNSLEKLNIKFIDSENNEIICDTREKIYVYDDLTQSEIASIKDLAKYLQLPVVMVHVGRKKVK